jgi:hypothetical protein
VSALLLAVEDTLLTEGARDPRASRPNEVAIYQPLGRDFAEGGADEVALPFDA